MKRTLKSTGLSTKHDAKLEELLCIAIETRMTEFLRKLARAGRAAEDGSALGPIKIRSKPEEELKKLAGLEEVEQLRRQKKLKEELDRIAENNPEDARVRQMLDDQAGRRAAAAASDAAILMARGPKSKSVAPLPVATASASSGGGGRGSKSSGPQPDADVRVAQMKKDEGQALTAEEEKLLGDWDRRSSAVSAGKRKIEEARQRTERRVGVKELLFVMDSDPYFKSVRMQTSLKAGFLGRGVAGETRVLMRE